MRVRPYLCGQVSVYVARTSESESEELEEEEEEEESLELSEAMPVDSWRSTLSAMAETETYVVRHSR